MVRAAEKAARRPRAEVASDPNRDAVLTMMRAGAAAKTELAARRSRRELVAPIISGGSPPSTAGKALERIVLSGFVDELRIEGEPLTLEASRLSGEQATELAERWENRRDEDGELDDEAIREIEALVGIAFGSEHAFEEARERRRQAKDLQAELEAMKLGLAPPQAALVEPGTVQLPGYLFGWLRDHPVDRFSLSDVGALALFAWSFEFQDVRCLASRAGGAIRVELVDGEPEIRVPGELSDTMPAGNVDDGGNLRFLASIDALRVNGFLESERRDGGFVIRRGPRLQALRPAATSA